MKDDVEYQEDEDNDIYGDDKDEADDFDEEDNGECEDLEDKEDEFNEDARVMASTTTMMEKDPRKKKEIAGEREMRLIAS